MQKDVNLAIVSLWVLSVTTDVTKSLENVDVKDTLPVDSVMNAWPDTGA